MQRQNISLICVALCWIWLLPPASAQQAAAPAKPPAPAPAQAKKPAAAPMFTFKATAELTQVNLSAKDSHGDNIKDLKQSDITILEDGKPQTIASFDFENVDAAPAVADAADDAAGSSLTTLSSVAVKPKPVAVAAAAEAPSDKFRDHRLWVLYFDMTTMQPEDVQNVMEQATKFVNKTMQPADLVSIVSLGNSLQLNQDFTADKDYLLRALAELNPATSSGFATADDGTDGSVDDGNSFSADDSEFNIANADRSLESLQSTCDMLAGIQQKKSLMWYSSGIQRSGVDNEITLRSAVNSCVKANTSIYGVDARGLQATPPGGNATSGSQRGSSPYNGNSQSAVLNNQEAQQETIATLSNDTGGAAFLDSNDFGPVYAKVQNDTKSYYLIGYISTNHAKDGKYRKITIKVNRPGMTVTARPGYYAPKDINHLNTADRQQQLQDELNADVTDRSLDLYLADGYLRLDKGKYFVPVSITIPGSEIPLHGINPKATPEVDVAGEVIDQTGRKLDHVGQTIPITAAVSGGAASELQNKNLQYNTGFILAPGQKYQIRFAARENQTGQMGAFETVLTIPDLDSAPTNPTALAMSSVIMGSQLAPTRPDPDNPLTASGSALVMNVNHVFGANQDLYVYFEVYDPKITSGADNIKLMTNVAFYRGGKMAFESQLLTTEQVTDPKRKAAVIQLRIPLSSLKAGRYDCQVNAIDDGAGRFAFPRFPILVRAAAAAAAGASPSK